MRPAPASPCDHCPAGEACPAIAKRIGRYCEVLDPSEPGHNPRHAADMAAMLRGEPHPAYARAGVTPPAPTAPVAELARLAAAVNRCPVRETIRCGCADRRAWCKLDPEQPTEKAHADCLDCVRRSPPA